MWGKGRDWGNRTDNKSISLGSNSQVVQQLAAVFALRIIIVRTKIEFRIYISCIVYYMGGPFFTFRKYVVPKRADHLLHEQKNFWAEVGGRCVLNFLLYSCNSFGFVEPRDILSLDATVQLCGTFESIDPLQVHIYACWYSSSSIVVLTVLRTVRAG